MLQQFINWSSQSFGSGWAWVVAELIPPPALPNSYHHGQLSSTTRASPPNSIARRGRSQLSCSHALQLATSPGPSLLCYPGKIFSCSHDLRASYPSCFSWQEVLCGLGGHLSHITSSLKRRGRDSCSILTPLDRLTLPPGSALLYCPGSPLPSSQL